MGQTNEELTENLADRLCVGLWPAETIHASSGACTASRSWMGSTGWMKGPCWMIFPISCEPLE